MLFLQIFIMVSAFRQTDLSKDLPTRASDALQTGGLSLTVSSFTNVSAFAIGSTTVIPELSSFCIYAAMVFVYLFFVVCTFFVAVLVLNEQRVTARRLDVLCCAKDCRPTEKTDELRRTFHSDSWLTQFIRHRASPFILHPVVRAVILLGSLGFVSWCAYNITLLEVEDVTNDFIPNNSYLRTNFELQSQYFGGSDTEVFLITGQFHYFDKRAEFANLDEAFRFPSTFETEPPFIRPDFNFWHDDFLVAIAINAPGMNVIGSEVAADPSLPGSAVYPISSNLFYKYLRNFVDGPGAFYSDDIVFTDSSRTQIARTRTIVDHIPIGNFQESELFKEDPGKVVDAVNKMYQISDSFSFEVYPYSFVYTSDWASYEVIQQELVRNIGLALLAVGVMTFILIGHPVTSFVAFACVSVSIVEVLGLQAPIGLAISTVTVLLLTIAVGLATDYVVHVANAVMIKTGSREERVIEAVSDVGVAVLNGALSTFLAVVTQSASDR